MGSEMCAVAAIRNFAPVVVSKSCKIASRNLISKFGKFCGGLRKKKLIWLSFTNGLPGLIPKAFNSRLTRT